MQIPVYYGSMLINGILRCTASMPESNGKFSALQELTFSSLKLRWSRHQKIELGMLWRACYAKIEMGLGEGINIIFCFSNIEAGKLVKSPLHYCSESPTKSIKRVNWLQSFSYSCMMKSSKLIWNRKKQNQKNCTHSYWLANMKSSSISSNKQGPVFIDKTLVSC